jgi:competence protein ComEC
MVDRRVQPVKATGRALAAPWDAASGWRWRLAGADYRAALRAMAEREAEGRRPFLWLPVAMGLGSLLYFAAEREPALLAPVLAVLVCVAAAAAARRGHRLLFAVFVALAAVFIGFAAGVLRTWSLGHGVLDRPLIGTVTGWIEIVEPRDPGARLLVRVRALEGTAVERVPARVRVTTARPTFVQAGDSVTFKARLLPPPEAAQPGGYDFARDAYFQGIGAVGSILGPLALAPGPEPPLRLRLWAAIDRARIDMTLRIAQVIGGQAGAVAAALVTGKRGLVTEETNEVLRAAGIYHVISISGLHMVLAAGIVFWLTRALLALVPGLALVAPIKKLAALAGIGAAIVYGVFAGAEVATARSMLMTIVMFGGVLADRPALSMRSLALAALLLIAVEPEAVLGPSFQMSFFAVAALIALHERTGAGAPEAAAVGLKSWLGEPPPESLAARVPPLARAGALLLLAPLLMTLAAEIATAPFGLFHFQQMASFGILGNAITLPVVSFIVMPAALLGALAMPFGLDAPVWWAMGFGVDLMLTAAGLVARLPGAITTTPALPVAALLSLSLGLLWLLLWRTWLRLAGLPMLGVGLLLAASATRPDIIVARDGAAMMVRGEGGRLVLAGQSPGRFVLEQWLRADEDPRDAQDAGLRTGAACDGLGCVARLRDGRTVALVTDAGAFEEDCRRAAVVVTKLAAPAWCRPDLLIDKTVLAAQGATAVWVTGQGLVAQGARNTRAQRPWTPTAAKTKIGEEAPMSAPNKGRQGGNGQGVSTPKRAPAGAAGSAPNAADEPPSLRDLQ